MLSALIYLRFTSLKNWFLKSLQGLRRPRQAIATLVGLLYLWFFFFRPLGGSGRASRNGSAQQALEAAQAGLPTDWLPLALAIGALAMLTFVTLIWVVPSQRAALGFSEAEIAFLFPAPISRHSLIHFRLLSAQLRSLLGAIVMMLISNRWSFLGGNAFTHAIGWWFVFSTLNLHYSGATFHLTRLSDAGGSTWRRRALVGGLAVAALAVAIWRTPASEITAGGSAGLRPFTDTIVLLANSAPLSWLLLPLKFILGPFLAADLRAFLWALPPALLVVGVHYFWVVKSAVTFEDAAIESAQRRSARAAAWRSGQRHFGSAPTEARPAPFALAGPGRPEIAFLWKNLLSTWPYFNRKVFAVSAIVIITALTWTSRHPEWRALQSMAGGLAGFVGLYLLVIGPQFARQDIRSDLANADILKTYPLPGWQLILGELLAPVAILTGVLWLALLTFALAFDPSPDRAKFAWLTPSLRFTCAAWLALIMPALVALQLLVPNAAALLFPAWFQASRTRGGGPEAAGQRMIFFFSQLITMLLALLPAAGFGALLIFILTATLHLAPALAVSIAALPVLLILLGEVWCGVWLLGQRFEHFDLSAELRSPST